MEELQRQHLGKVLFDLDVTDLTKEDSGSRGAITRILQARNKTGDVFSVSVSVCFNVNPHSVIIEKVSAGNITLVANKQGVITSAQGPVYRVLGCQQKELLGLSLNEVVSKEILSQLSQHQSHGITTELSEFLHRDHLFPCVISTWQPVDRDGVCVCISPVGEHREAVLIYSMDGSIAEANLEFKLLTGVAEAVVPGTPLASRCAAPQQSDLIAWDGHLVTDFSERCGKRRTKLRKNALLSRDCAKKPTLSFL